MNINFSSILSGGMRILNIVNKTLPLVKEFNPTIKKVVTKFKNNNNNTLKLPKITIKEKENKLVTNNNTLTFFK